MGDGYMTWLERVSEDVVATRRVMEYPAITPEDVDHFLTSHIISLK